MRSARVLMIALIVLTQRCASAADECVISLRDLHGTPERPLVIDGGGITVNGAGSISPMRVKDCSYLIVRNFDLCNSATDVLRVTKSEHCTFEQICAWDVAATVAWKASNKNNATLWIGTIPYSDPALASTQEAKAIQNQLNIGLEGIACGVRGAYVNPWYALVSGSQAADIPTANPVYIEDGLHYLAPGASLVTSKAASAVEQGIVGGWWTNPARRTSRSKGLLFPR